jgi:hypothetical protein
VNGFSAIDEKSDTGGPISNLNSLKKNCSCPFCAAFLGRWNHILKKNGIMRQTGSCGPSFARVLSRISVVNGLVPDFQNFFM